MKEEWKQFYEQTKDDLLVLNKKIANINDQSSQEYRDARNTIEKLKLSILLLEKGNNPEYSVKSTGDLGCLPALFFLISSGIFLYFLLAKSDFEPYSFTILVVLAVYYYAQFSIISPSSLSDADKYLRANINDFPLFSIDYDKEYTYNINVYYLLKIFKVIWIISSLVFVVAIGLILFSLLGTISVAPTTIIIILLVWILAKQYEDL